MKKFNLKITDPDLPQTIPYYSKRFETLKEVLENKRRELNKNGYTINQYVEIETIISGMKYYCDAIITEKEWAEERHQQVCRKLVECTNRGIFALLNGSSINDQKAEDCLIAYREYLQKIGNTFRKEKENEKIVSPYIIFSFALNLMSSRVYVDKLFPTIYDSRIDRRQNVLCTVFAPSDIDIKEVHKYLPMLTHEVSHNFKYSQTEDRNKFIVDYMLNSICRALIQQLFNQVSDNYYMVFAGKAEKTLANVVKEVLKKEIFEVEPDYIKQGHIDYLPSLIYSVLNAIAEKDGNLEDLERVDEDAYDILKKAFLNLVKLSDMEWYLADKEDANKYTDEQVIASLLLDIFTEKDFNQVRKWYLNIPLSDDDCRSIKEEALKNNGGGEIYIPAAMINISVDEIVISVMKRIKSQFNEFGKNGLKEDTSKEKKGKSLDKVILALIENTAVFDETLENVRVRTKKGYQQIMFEFVDICITARNCINNIYYLRKLYDGGIIKKSRCHQKIKNIFKALHQAVLAFVQDINEKPYFPERGELNFIRKMNTMFIRWRQKSFIYKFGLY